MNLKKAKQTLKQNNYIWNIKFDENILGYSDCKLSGFVFKDKQNNKGLEKYLITCILDDKINKFLSMYYPSVKNKIPKNPISIKEFQLILKQFENFLRLINLSNHWFSKQN